MCKEIKPDVVLSKYIDAFWVFRNNMPHDKKEQILPDGCSDIIVSYKNGKVTPFIVGIMTKPIESLVYPSETLFGIRFKAGYASILLDMHMNYVVNEKYYISNQGIFHDHLFEVIAENKFSKNSIAENFTERVLSTMAEKTLDKRIQYVIRAIKISNGSAKINTVAVHANISRRHLERIFLKTVGISPKEYARIIRFLSIKAAIEKSKKYSMACLAQDFGYYDQSHMYKDYKEFTGLYPVS